MYQIVLLPASMLCLFGTVDWLEPVFKGFRVFCCFLLGLLHAVDNGLSVGADVL